MLLSNSIALPLQQHHANLDNSTANLENSTNYQTSFDTSLLSSGTNAGYSASKPFSIAGAYGTFSYRENGFIMASGVNSNGQLGDTTKVNVGTPFALYKEGDVNQPFYNAIDYNVTSYSTSIVDSTGKVYTTGFGGTGGLGNGLSSAYLGDYGSGSYQWTFQQVITQSSDRIADANKANALPDDYKAISVALSYNGFILLDDGTLYGTGREYRMGLGTSNTAQTHYTRLDGRATGLPAVTSSNKIKDISAGSSSSWVLYENGELYMTSNSQPGYYNLVASDIKFFDLDDEGQRVYAVNTSNQILSASQSSSTLTTLVENPVGTVTQVRGSNGGGWGYLNSNNELYLSTTAEGVVPGASNSTQTGTTFYKMDNVAFFDIGGASSRMTYGVMYTNGAMTVWGDNSYGQLGNGEVGNGDTTDPDYVPSTPESGLKDDVTFAPEDIPNVEDDVFTGEPDVDFSDEPNYFPIGYIPPARPSVILIKINVSVQNKTYKKKKRSFLKTPRKSC